MPVRRIQQVTIPNGTALSGALETGDAESMIIVMPAAWTAAAITFVILAPGATSGAGDVTPVAGAEAPAYDDAGTELTIASAAAAVGRAIVLGPLAMQAMVKASDRIRLRSGTVGAPVNQGADRVFTVFLN